MSSRRDDVRRVGGIVRIKSGTPTRRLASLVGDLPHKGEVVGVWQLVIALMTLDKFVAATRRIRTPNQYSPLP